MITTQFFFSFSRNATIAIIPSVFTKNYYRWEQANDYNVRPNSQLKNMLSKNYKKDNRVFLSNCTLQISTDAKSQYTVCVGIYYIHLCVFTVF
jgi:hypothetical protein